MPTPLLSDNECWNTIRLLFQHGDATTAAAAAGVSVNCINYRLQVARLRYPGIVPDCSKRPGWCKGRLPKRPAPADVGDLSPAKLAKAVAPEAPVDPLDARRGADQAHALRLRVADLERDLIAQQDWRRKMERLSSAVIPPAKWPKPASGKRDNPLIPLLFTSDFQTGEVVRPEEIDGMNAYSADIFRQRYELMISKTIKLATENTGATSFPHVVYLRGGDAISGGLHEELAVTDDLSSIPAVRAVLQAEREGIRRLADKLGRVRVVSLVGNHGRTTFKPRAKQHVERNFETLLAWWLQSSFDGDDRVSFYTPSSTDALFKVFDWNVLASHGDKMGARGGTGFIGPAANIAKGHRKLYDNWTMTGAKIDLVLTAHLHTSLKLERGYSNGSLAGFNEYARDLRCTPDAAKQWLLFFSQKEMVSHAFELALSPRPIRSIVDTSA